MEPERDQWRPVERGERYAGLDLIRGAALFGVLLVNLETLFRVSLFQHMLTFHTHEGWWNRAADVLVAGLLEFKAFDLFSISFGIGLAIQAERAAAHGVNAARFLLRRFAVLLVFGIAHMLLVWNGDILTLYAICGFLLMPLLGLPARQLAWSGVAAMALAYVLPLGRLFPEQAVLAPHAAEAASVYGQGRFAEILVFRCDEAWRFIVPLLVASLPKVAGLMLFGAAVSRWGVPRNPEAHRRLLTAVALGAGAVGGTVTAMAVHAESAGRAIPIPGVLDQFCSDIPLAVAYGAAVLLWSTTPAGRITGWLAAAGQMALTNYLAQSVILGFLFYGYGLGLFGRLGPAPAALIGIAIYAVQLAASRVWLGRYRFGPFEWVWRSLSYGRPQPMRRRRAAAA